MRNLSSFRKKVRKRTRTGVENAREYIRDLRDETAPGRERLGRELKRQSPKLAAFALATAFEMMRGYRPRRRLKRAVALGILAGAALVLLRAVNPRR
jgi:hypothetical protein